MIASLQTLFRRRIKPFLLSKTAQWLFSLLTITLTFLVLGLFLWREREALLNNDWSIDPLSFIWAFLIYTATTFLASYLWVRIIHTMGARVSFWTHFRHYSISMLAKRLPGTVWYVAFRNQMYQKEGLPPSLTTVASGIEYALLLVSTILMTFLFAFPVTRNNPVQLWLILVVLVLFASFLHPRILRWILRKVGKLDSQVAYRHIVTWLAAYIVVRLLSGMLVFFIVRIIYPLPLDDIWTVIGGWSMSSVITHLLLFFPSNMGITEVTLSLVLSSLMPSSIAVIAAIMTRILIISFELFWALASLLAQFVMTRRQKITARENV